ncbi:MAG: DegT/DnrJ/EryC1/StrS family aminotransferase [Ruminococcaceae bacterium]|nr:DegT/DnrJ/EryC1/StrS family aminotransferase [Oscillospiraceae bacterium]
MTKINVTRSSMPSYEEYCEAIKPIFESKWLTNMGPIHNEFMDKVGSYLGVDNVSLFTNGHLALCIAIRALGLTGEVITTPFTFASTTHAIVDSGLTPVFCDVNPDTYTIDADKIEALITDETSAIMPVHVYGNVCDVEKIDTIAKKYNLKVIYDAAHVFGVKIGDRGIGSFGDVSMFSFHATKVFNTIEGGCLTYSNKSLESKISPLRNFGITSPESVDMVGTNAKMNEFQAAMGLCNLKYIDENIAERKLAEKAYRARLENIDGIKLSPVQEGVTQNHAYFPVVFEGFKYNRDEVAQKLSENGVFARKYFYPITNEFSCYKGKYRGETPVAKKISENVLTLPMYAGLTEDEVKMICDIILK